MSNYYNYIANTVNFLYYNYYYIIFDILLLHGCLTITITMAKLHAQIWQFWKSARISETIARRAKITSIYTHPRGRKCMCNFWNIGQWLSWFSSRAPRPMGLLCLLSFQQIMMNALQFELGLDLRTAAYCTSISKIFYSYSDSGMAFT